MSEYTLTIVPFGIRRDVHFCGSECYGVATGKCSLTDWSVNLEEKYEYSSCENSISYCRRLAQRILTYDNLVKNYLHIINNSDPSLDDARTINQILRNVGYLWCNESGNNYVGDKLFVQNAMANAREFISGWEEKTNIKMLLRSCGHFSFTDGRHRSCIADRLGVPIKVYIDRYDKECNPCYYLKKHKWYRLLSFAEKLTGKKQVPL